MTLTTDQKGNVEEKALTADLVLPRSMRELVERFAGTGAEGAAPEAPVAGA